MKIGDDLQEQLRKSSSVMCRLINAQAEFWMKVGMLAELNPTLPLTEIMAQQLKNADVQVPEIEAA
ncbi:ParD-like family protein [Rhodobacteraceae bacterium M385]|nr:ParD-like family protein [Rhodobacteraceae bacterium M385]